MRGHRVILGLLAGVLLWGTSAAESGQAPRRSGVCLVLSGGGARGLAHIGVLQALEEEGLAPAAVVGTSAGALVGSLYCAGYTSQQIGDLFLTMDYVDLIREEPDRRLVDYDQKAAGRFPGLTLYLDGRALDLPSGIIAGQGVIKQLDRAFTAAGVQHVHDFDRLPVPFRCVAADLRHGRTHTFSGGRLTQAVRASISIPSVFTPVELDGMLLVDGGILNNIPVDIARELGYPAVVAVNVSGSTAPERKKLKNLMEIWDESSTLVRQEKDRQLMAMADLVVAPDVLDFSIADFHLAAELIQKGYAAARADLPRLREVFAAAPGAPPRAAPDRRGYQRTLEVVELVGDDTDNPLEALIKSEARLGKPATPDALERSVEKIYAMDRYRTVGYDLKLDNGEAQLAYLVDKLPKASLTLALRYDTDYQFTGRARWLDRNVLRSGSDLELDMLLGQLKEFRFGLRTPVPAGIPVVWRNDLFFSRTPHKILYQKEPVEMYDEKHYGFTTGLTVDAGNVVGLYGALVFEKANMATYGRFDERGSDRITLLRVGVGLDTLDRWVFPRSGCRIDAHVDRALPGLGGDLDYTRITGTADAYWPLTENNVLRVSGYAGWGVDVPAYFIHFAGGQNDLRMASTPLPGYAVDEIFGRDLWTGRVEYRRRFPSPTLGLSSDAYLLVRYGLAGARYPDLAGGVIELGVPYRYFHGGGVGYALATLLGPLQIFVGAGESGRWELTITLGPDF